MWKVRQIRFVTSISGFFNALQEGNKGIQRTSSVFASYRSELFFHSQIFIKLCKVDIFESCHVKNGLGQRLPCHHALLTIRILISPLDLGVNLWLICLNIILRFWKMTLKLGDKSVPPLDLKHLCQVFCFVAPLAGSLHINKHVCYSSIWNLMKIWRN